MDKNNKEYIVTKIEKYNEILDDEKSYESMLKFAINVICLVILAVLYKIHLSLPFVPEDLDIVVNQILDDASLFGLATTLYNCEAKVIKMSYASIMGEIWNDKLQKNDIENQTGTLTIENNEGKNRYYENRTYYLLVNSNDMSDVKFCYEKGIDSALLESNDKEINQKLLPLFLKATNKVMNIDLSKLDINN